MENPKTLKVEHVKMKDIKPQEIDILKHPVKVYISPPGTVINTKGEGYVTSRGSDDFPIVIRFDGLFASRRMYDSFEQKARKEWAHGLTYDLRNCPDPEMRQKAIDGLETIETVANSGKGNYDPIYDPSAINKYWTEGADKIIEVQKGILGSPKKKIALVAARAGYPMTARLGFSEDQMVICDPKRLKEKNNPQNIAVGLRFSEGQSLENALQTLKQGGYEAIISADPALATLSTQLAFLAICLAKNIDVPQQKWLAIAASQQGLQLAKEISEQMEDQQKLIINTITGGSFPGLTGGEHSYYIYRNDKNGIPRFAVGDGGDFSELLLPSHLRKLWPKEINSLHLIRLVEKYGIDGRKVTYLDNLPVTLETMVKTQEVLNEIKPGLPQDALGKILTDPNINAKLSLAV